MVVCKKYFPLWSKWSAESGAGLQVALSVCLLSKCVNVSVYSEMLQTLVLEPLPR